MNRIPNSAMFILLATLLISCQGRNEQKGKILPEDMTEEEFETGQVREIFYNMYLPEEMSRIFEQVGANFDPDIPVSPDDFSRFQQHPDIACAIGAYGVDLNYAKLFDQDALTGNYFTIIRVLSEKLEIPESYYEDLFERIDDPFFDRDSIAATASEIYEKTDAYLKKNGKGADAALIVMGGWIEALYIAGRIYEENPTNMEIMDRIAEQKYSLNSLIFLLSNYQDDLKNAEYLLYLKKLQEAFNKFEIYFEVEDFHIDTASRTIKTSGYDSEMNQDIASEIISLIMEIRENIVG